MRKDRTPPTLERRERSGPIFVESEPGAIKRKGKTGYGEKKNEKIEPYARSLSRCSIVSREAIRTHYSSHLLQSHKIPKAILLPTGTPYGCELKLTRCATSILVRITGAFLSVMGVLRLRFLPGRRTALGNSTSPQLSIRGKEETCNVRP